MNRKKAIILVATLLAIILVVAVVICVTVTGGSNNSPASSTPSSEDVGDTPKENLSDSDATKLLNEVFDSIKTDDSATPTLLDEIDKKNGFEIVSNQKDGTDFLVTLKVYSIDIYTIAKDLDANHTFNSAEEIEAAVMSALAQADVVEKEVELTFQYTSEGYRPVMSEEFLDAYYGGIFRLLNEFLGQSSK